MKYEVWKACGGWQELWYCEVKELKLPHVETVTCTCGCYYDVMLDIDDKEKRFCTYCTKCGHNIEVYIFPYLKEGR